MVSCSEGLHAFYVRSALYTQIKMKEIRGLRERHRLATSLGSLCVGGDDGGGSLSRFAGKLDKVTDIGPRL